MEEGQYKASVRSSDAELASVFANVDMARGVG